MREMTSGSSMVGYLAVSTIMIYRDTRFVKVNLVPWQ